MADGRLLCCDRCDKLVILCSRCDRGNQYCSRECSAEARREAMMSAGRRYQLTERGRMQHARRQKRYRLDHKVTTKILSHLARKGIQPGRAPPEQ